MAAVIVINSNKTMSGSPAKVKVSPKNEYLIIKDAKASVSSMLKDPDSAKFKDIFFGNGIIVCGMVSGKNSFGAYNGYQDFVSNGKITVLSSQIDDFEFIKVWAKLCDKRG